MSPKTPNCSKWTCPTDGWTCNQRGGPMSILKRRPRRKFLRKREGFTLFEVLASLLIISVTAVGAGYGFMVGHAMYQREERARRALMYMKADMDYWMARIHSNLPPLSYFRGQPPAVHVIDRMGPGTGDDVELMVRLTGIFPVDDIETSEEPDYYEIHLVGTWRERGLSLYNAQQEPTTVKIELQAPMIRGNI
ncbi:prepilin-type N-terminal cleavage/methylation domain-containing protein [bacterium]|nr:prepilin-type N-terminal cleavage/methylation domain-containing protein [bacterium]